MRILSALLLSIFSALAHAQGLEGPVTMFFSSDRPIPAPILTALQREAEAAVFPSLIRLAWHSGDLSESPTVHFRLAVVRFRGDCRLAVPQPIAPRAAKLDIEALGQTQTVNGEVLPIADIHCDAVRQFLERDLRGIPAPEQPEALGRALGRVVAHELYHMLLRTRTHGRTGLGRPVLSRAELLSPRQTFAPAEEQRLAEAFSGETTTDVGGR